MTVQDAAPIDVGSMLVSGLPAISLQELDDVASLQRRVDRKYVVTASQLTDLVDHLSHRLAALEIDGQRSFSYESTYFDTLDLTSFHDAAYRRRQRFKVRTRSYVESGTTMLEVKTRDGRGNTIKRRQGHDHQYRRQLDDAAVAFIDSTLGAPGLGRTLQPSLITSYRRTTLVDLDDVARVTVDAELRFIDRCNRSGGLGGRFVVETKSSGSAGFVDRYLWQIGIRPEKISKYGTGLAVLNPSLPSNKWHRTIKRHFLASI